MKAFLVAQVLLIYSGAAVVVQKVTVPNPSVAGHTARLECLWSVGGGPPLYSVRWCKDGQQFFVVILLPRRQKRVFNLPGVQVVVGSSDENVVSLTNVTALTSGSYTCEAMSDGPDFLSTARSAHLFVVEVPGSGPKWTGVLSVYHVGQHLHAHCNVFRSRPPPIFKFFVNGLQTTSPHEWIINHEPEMDHKSMTWNTSSTLSIPFNSVNTNKIFLKSSHNSHVTLPDVLRSDTRPSHLKSYSVRHFRDPKFSDLWTERLSDQEAELPPGRRHERRSGRYTRNTKTSHLNLTCVADVAGLSFKTTTWSTVLFPVELHPSREINISRNAGYTMQSADRWIFILYSVVFLLPVLR